MRPHYSQEIDKMGHTNKRLGILDAGGDRALCLQQLDKICNCPLFNQGGKVGRLAKTLEFVGIETLMGHAVTEPIISLEIYGTPNPRDARVRVNLYNVRKRLSTYYLL